MHAANSINVLESDRDYTTFVQCTAIVGQSSNYIMIIIIISLIVKINSYTACESNECRLNSATWK